MSKKNPRIQKNGRKLTIKSTMHRHVKTKLEPERDVKRAMKNARTEMWCCICKVVKPTEQFKVRVRNTFTKENSTEYRSFCLSCEKKRKKAQDRRNDEFDKEEFYSPYANAYALGHSFDEDLNCTGSGCHSTFYSIQYDPIKCEGKLPRRGKPRSNKRMMVKSVNRYRRY
jgi:hypothetical protein